MEGECSKHWVGLQIHGRVQLKRRSKLLLLEEKKKSPMSWGKKEWHNIIERRKFPLERKSSDKGKKI